MNRLTVLIAGAAVSLALGGCQSFFGLAGEAPAATAVQTASANAIAADYFAQRLEAGRLELLRNRPTLAVIAFRQASYDPAHAGSAYNGMAIAYAQIGRTDLAERYFREAVAADPADERFARNLAVLTGSPQPPARAGAQPSGDRGDAVAAASPTAAPPAPATGAAPAVLDAQVTAPAFVRVSPTQVRVVSAAAQPAPQPGTELSRQAVVTVSRRPGLAGRTMRTARPAVTIGRRNYSARIAFAAVPNSRGNYPVRIALPQSR